MPVLLVTRPEPDASETARQIEALGIETRLAPLLEMKVLETALPPASGLGAVALTSANAVNALTIRDALAPYLDLPAFAVGDRTARVAQDAGFSDVRSAAGTVEDLAGLLAAEKPAGAVFYPAAHHLSADLAGLLAPSGIEVMTTRVYDMQPVNDLPADIAAALESGSIDGALFYSRRTAETFTRLVRNLGLGDQVRAHVTALCLSENVAEPLVEARLPRIALADYSSAEAMLALALSFSRDQIGP